MDTSRRFDSKVGAELWLEREGVAGQPILLQTSTDERGRVIRKEWAIVVPRAGSERRDSDLMRRWESKLGAQMWLADNPETEGEPELLRAPLDYNGKTTREVWVIRTQDGYLTSEERGGGMETPKPLELRAGLDG